MTERTPKVGKVPPHIFDRLIFKHTGGDDKAVLVGPRHGVDFGVIEIGDKALIFTTDPVFIVPEYGWERSAWFAVHILASDGAVSGIKPRFMTIDLNLPMDMTDEALETVWTTMHEECKKLGISIVCGHTGRYAGCNYPMVGGATVIGVGDKDKYVTPEMARPGDQVIITKGPAIEATGIFSVSFPDRLIEAYGEEFAKRAQDFFWKMTVVKDALTAASVGVREGGVTSMHDATECGVWGGLYEVASASKVGMRVHQERIIFPDEVRKVCDFFGIDPFTSISEGTLILTVVPEKTKDVLSVLAREGIRASVVGEVLPENRGRHIVLPDGEETELVHPIIDPFWEAFFKAIEERGG